MKTHNVQSLQYWNENPTSGEAIFKDLPGSFDYALPQPWLDAFAKSVGPDTPLGDEPYYAIMTTTVWSYDGGSHSGQPVTCCEEVAAAFAAYTGEEIAV